MLIQEPNAGTGPNAATHEHRNLRLQALLETGRRRARAFAARLARCRGVSGADLEDFCSEVTLKLLLQAEAMLEDFRGDATIDTYLETVVRNCWRDFLIRRHGKWRPSARAQKLGALAIELEQLRNRDGHSEEEAFQILRQSWHRPLSRKLVEGMVERLPRGVPSCDVELDQVPAASLFAAHCVAEDSESQFMRRHAQQALLKVLVDALPDLEPEEATLLYRHFWEGIPISTIARQMGLRQRCAYTLKDRALARLRRRLEGAGLDGDVLRGAFSDDASLEHAALEHASLEQDIHVAVYPTAASDRC